MSAPSSEFLLKPLVLPVTLRSAERDGPVDVYPPDTGAPAPAVLIVHGGPLAAEARPRPRDWPVLQAYASALAADGLVGAVVEHGLHTPADFPRAAEDVAAAVAALRRHPRVDPQRVALWFFSGSAPLLLDWLRDPPPWLRCLAASYPVFQDAVTEFPTGLPIVLTRIGREAPQFAALVDRFVDDARAAGATLELVDVPEGRHSFHVIDDDDASRAAIARALDAVGTALRNRP